MNVHSMLYVLLMVTSFLLLRSVVRKQHHHQYQMDHEHIGRSKHKEFYGNRYADFFNGTQNRWLKHQRLKHLRQSGDGPASGTLKQVARLMEHRANNLRGARLVLWMLLGAGLGWWIGHLVDNGFIALIVALVGLGLPVFHVQNGIRHYERDRNEKLLLVLSSLQAEYIKPHMPFVHAVTAVLPTMPDPIYLPFKRYADTVNLFHPDSPVEALRELEQEMENYFFTEYICLAMLAEEGEHGLKSTMSAIPDEYQNYLETNRNFSYKVAHYNQNFQMTLMTFPLMVGFLKVVSGPYFEILTHHPLGKITLSALTVLYLVAALIFNRLNSDVKLEL